MALGSKEGLETCHILDRLRDLGRAVWKHLGHTIVGPKIVPTKFAVAD